MTTQQLHLFNGLYLIAQIVVAVLTMATWRRIAGSLIGGMVVGVVVLGISCHRNHKRYTLCGYHHSEGHEGNWKTCPKCREDQKTEMYVWFGTNEYNFEKLENPPSYEPTHCATCGRVIRLAEDTCLDVFPRARIAIAHGRGSPTLHVRRSTQYRNRAGLRERSLETIVFINAELIV